MVGVIFTTQRNRKVTDSSPHPLETRGKCLPYGFSIKIPEKQFRVFFQLILKMTSTRIVKTQTRKRRENTCARGRLEGHAQQVERRETDSLYSRSVSSQSRLYSCIPPALFSCRNCRLLSLQLKRQSIPGLSSDSIKCLLQNIIYRGRPLLAIKSKERRRFAAKVPFTFDKRRERRDTVANEMMCPAEDSQVQLRQPWAEMENLHLTKENKYV